MQTRATQILQEVFGHAAFRPVQEQIIESVLTGKDTLAVMPTGGGKSLCYQIPALVHEGICLVVSPLIALMKDQVDGLQKKGIKAAAVFSGMSRREIDLTLDNCIYGDYKFLYVSPERLKSDLFIERFRQMKVNLIAVDEAHCISQWGYDFRPPYLEIAEIRKYHPGVSVLALTASATPQVCADILEKLEMKNPAEFHKSFARKNLSYSVRQVENKLEKGIEILSRIDGTAIWYVRNRQATHQIARALTQIGIPASAYHAGLSMQDRSMRQEAWMKNEVRVMVSTNAFGMGIDKPDVRVVLHSDLPENLENYYQEAGRAGRDTQKAYAVLMANQQDFEKVLDRAALVYAPLDFVKRVYQCLANYFRIAVGSNMLSSFDFEWSEFANTYDLGVLETFYTLKLLEEEGFIGLSESYYSPSKIHFLVDPSKLYEIQIAYAKLDPLVKIIMRTYGGNVFSDYIKIQEAKIAKALGIAEQAVISGLKKLEELEVMVYDQRKDKPQITFLTPRYDAGKLPLNFKRIELRRELTLEKAKRMVEYADQATLCRTQYIQEYFGEETDEDCGVCDVCIAKRKNAHPNATEEKLKQKFLETLKANEGLTKEQLFAELRLPASAQNLGYLRKLEDQGFITLLPNGTLTTSGHE
ncbi:RecQ family ATP-dependent DNA helicase [Algoriphagus halophytocola]|uniref:ATP-dependent DNA helicase RecQ n=1 Tax=Algoriphagus halophytocola TaxID=2991499 RepID=A0ABY6MPZ1_9BACT|nr:MULTISPECIES: ATP-dependent DNA helicase RecQ [unclassified Algoriphagus]UZD24626.1 RecQ family ATP-dependent DNA helicase [Algoriphagus sp. TR-M5]WBL41994.1 RecQ family ATP-dependent DNA helicase [Algoriphagus sp. TR-M9]